MTKEKAIDVLRNIGNEIDDFCNGCKHWSDKDKEELEAISMAIEALSRDADRPKDEPETEPAPVVAYICDRRRCAICSGEDGGCDHTTDIKHAAHFKNVAGQYFERPYMEKGKNDE